MRRAERGSILLGILVVFVIVAGLTMMLMENMRLGTADQATLREAQIINQHALEILNVLRDRAACELNFRDHATAAGVDDVSEIRAGPGAVVAREAEPLAQDQVRFTNALLHDFRGYTLGIPDTLRGTMALDLTYEAKNGGPVRRRTLLIAVETNAYPPARAGAPDAIKSCVALGTTTDIWRLTAASDIHYSANAVGVGVTAPAARLHVAGNVLARDYFSPSDVRLKENVRPLAADGRVGRLRGVRFDWRDGRGPALGVIAQEVAEVFPSAVKTNARWHAVDADQLIAPLVTEINALAARQRALRARLRRLR